MVQSPCDCGYNVHRFETRNAPDRWKHPLHYRFLLTKPMHRLNIQSDNEGLYLILRGPTWLPHGRPSIRIHIKRDGVQLGGKWYLTRTSSGWKFRIHRFRRKIPRAASKSIHEAQNDSREIWRNTRWLTQDGDLRSERNNGPEGQFPMLLVFGSLPRPDRTNPFPTQL